MNRKFTFGAFFIIAIFVSTLFINSVSAKNADENLALVSTTIVISQVYGGGGGSTGTYMFDYVELKNISSTPQSLDGLSLMYGSATGQFGSTSTNVFALPTGVTLQPGQFYLIQLSNAGSGGAALPVTPDVVTTNLSMSGSSGKIALTNGLAPNSCGATATPCALPNPQIIDLVAYGAASNAEGGAATNGDAALTSTQGNVRKSNGCQDTDNNNNDFDVVTAPVPRNSASPLAVCGGGTTPPVAKATLFDFTGNGRTDYTVFTNSFAVVGVPIRWNVLGNPAIPGPNQAFIRCFDFGLVGDSPVPNDYRGDKKVDVTVRRPSNGTYYVAQFPIGTGPIVLDAAVPFGTANDGDGVEGDYDGDGKADYTVVRANADNSLTYYMQLSGTNTFRAVPFGTLRTGIRTQLLRGADFNGDGRDDIVFAQNPSTGSSRPVTYFVGDSVTGVGIMTTQWGDFATDYSVTPADYTGDGRADLVVVRQSTPAETWYIRNTATGMGTAAGFGIGDPNFANTDLPVRGDYDGDGRHDLAVWRPSNQTFYFVQSSNNMVGSQKWGNTANDFPLGFLGVF